MTRLAPLLLLGASACAIARSGSPLLALQEDDPDAHVTSIPGATALVDVGSTIRIELQRDRIVAAAPGTTDATARLVQRYAALTEALRTLEAATPGIAAALGQWSERRTPGALTQLRDATAAAARPLDRLLDAATAPGGERFRRLLNEALENLPAGATTADQSNAVLRVTRTELSSLARDLEAALQTEGLALQLGAWVVSAEGARPVHLDGFDSYAPGARVPFDRWRLTLDEGQREQLRRAEGIAREINASDVVTVARAQGQLAVEALLRRTAAAAEAVTTEFEKLAATGGGPGAAAERLRQTMREVALFRDLLRGLSEKHRAARPATGAELLLGASADLQEVVRQGSVLVGRVRQDAAAARALVPAPAALAAALDGLERSLAEELGPVGAGLQAVLGLAAVNTEALRFGEEVRRVSVEQLPASTAVDLDATGRRSPGDSVVLKLAAVRGESAPVLLETRRVVMQRIVPHLDMTAGLVFARAPATADRPAGFQAAAGYSVLLKRGARGWPAWNTLLTPGLGLNLSALDFDRDNTPELGVAATVSLFRNIVQGGWGYNVFAGRWYAFFGIGLPLPALGGGPSAPASTVP